LLGFDAMNPPPACEGLRCHRVPDNGADKPGIRRRVQRPVVTTAHWQYLAAPLVEVAVCAAEELRHDKHIDFHRISSV
jgi:hypothetical protein